MSAKRSNTRIRPMSCESCGYHVYGTRSWWGNGFPTCCCGGTILPDKPEDLAYMGLIGPEDMSQADWNQICRLEGWAIVRNRGQAARRLTASVLSGRRGADHCAHPGCGLWIKDGADCCSAGHLQHSTDTRELEACAF